MRAKFTVADESSRKFSVVCESVVLLAIGYIFMRFSERFRENNTVSWQFFDKYTFHIARLHDIII